MRAVETIVRFSQLEPRLRRFAAEAVWNLALARIAIRLLPFRRAIDFGAIPLGEGSGGDAGAIVRSVEAAAWRLPWRSVCLDQGLALQRALRRRGSDARLHYGLTAPGEGPLSAHVWVVLDGDVLLGGERAGSHCPVAIFPAD